jgi:hypothetical protein
VPLNAGGVQDFRRQIFGVAIQAASCRLARLVAWRGTIKSIHDLRLRRITDSSGPQLTELGWPEAGLRKSKTF